MDVKVGAFFALKAEHVDKIKLIAENDVRIFENFSNGFFDLVRVFKASPERRTVVEIERDERAVLPGFPDRFKRRLCRTAGKGAENSSGMENAHAL